VVPNGKQAQTHLRAANTLDKGQRKITSAEEAANKNGELRNIVSGKLL
jgi:hypothetical protein